MKKKNSLPIFYITIVVLIMLSVLVVYQWYQKYYGSDYQQALDSELSNKCSTSSGYTDESWKEHMSHHPDRYGECLR